MPARGLRSDGDDFPPLVARPPWRTEVDANDHGDLGDVAKQETSVTMTFQFSPAAARKVQRVPAAPTVNSPAATQNHADARSVREATAPGPFTCSSRASAPMIDSSTAVSAARLLADGAER